MSWAKEEALRIINSEGFRDTPADVIAAALQSVANEAMDAVDKREQPLSPSHWVYDYSQYGKGYTAGRTVGKTVAIDAIRDRFPREGA